MPTVTKNKRGRPAKGVPTVRISPRFPKPVAEVVERASDLRGVSITAFVLESARQAAEQVIEEETRWRLDQNETAELARLLARPPQLNAVARRAEKLASDVDIRS